MAILLHSPHATRYDPWIRSAVAVAVAVAVFFCFGLFASLPTRSMAAWDGFALTLLILTWWSITVAKVESIRNNARRQDMSRTLSFLFTVGAACASMFAVVYLLSSAKKANHVGPHAALSIVAVLSSWALVHTVFALRYAHSYYGEGASPHEHVGGLVFPGDKDPNYFDFAYFSFVVGMTFQVSDVQVTSKPLRRLVLMHGILSFGFNTVILALSINTVSGFLA